MPASRRRRHIACWKGVRARASWRWSIPTKEADSMLEEPTSLRIEDPGVRALFTEAARFQSWLDVEAALAQGQAEVGIIPASAARQIVTKAHLKYLDLPAARSGLAKTRHPLVPSVW